VILNIAPDHLDRYTDYEDYVRSKLKIFRNQGVGQYLILNDDDERLSGLNPEGVAVLRYGLDQYDGRHAFIEQAVIRTHMEGLEDLSLDVRSCPLRGRHNVDNLMAIALVGGLMRVDRAVIQDTIEQFKGLSHRLEQVASYRGVQFFSDSKATNVDAAVKAISSFDEPVVLIAGGRHKGADYAPLARAASRKVKKAFFLGEAKDLLAASFEGVVPFKTVDNMEEAVAAADHAAAPGDVVLLAPACSSFDMFSDYAHRGRAFKAAVERLIDG
jgi:UDP-N-acetylmuramoylalanine--D-glutamate ligase